MILFLHTRVWDIIPTPALLNLEEFTIILKMFSVGVHMFHLKGLLK